MPGFEMSQRRPPNAVRRRAENLRKFLKTDTVPPHTRPRTMVKRKDTYEEAKGDGHDSSDSGNESEPEIVDVDFDFFDPRPDIDFHAIRNLLRQTFDADNVLFDLSALTDLILSQNTLGSTVKTDGIESDPFAFLTVINATEHGANPAVRQILDYLLLKSKPQAELNAELKRLVGQSAEDKSKRPQVGLILSERLINMPTEVAPPMYRMLVDEMTWAVQDNEPYKFDYYLFVGKSFTEIASKIDEEEDRPKKKKKAGKSSAQTFYFHAEDETIQAHSDLWMTYKFSKEAQEADSKRTFQDYGIMTQGQMMLMRASQLAPAIEAMAGLFAVPA
ncbi:p21-C-terminal region-binding protein-domain-containing protein [Dipodascopsis tothii]|uniref:p21-C-terminal region-binding protein-domain-containing protein n=1 Tax=Dipodascopsis tothii TaxID=44089 RepID=UPI0034CFD96B